MMMSFGGIKMGRKPIFEKPMTQVERNRRYLDKLKLRAKNNISATDIAENKKISITNKNCERNFVIS